MGSDNGDHGYVGACFSPPSAGPFTLLVTYTLKFSFTRKQPFLNVDTFQLSSHMNSQSKQNQFPAENEFSLKTICLNFRLSSHYEF